MSNIADIAKPFNLNQTEYEKMFECIKTSVLMPIMFPRLPGVTDDKVEEVVQKCEAFLDIVNTSQREQQALKDPIPPEIVIDAIPVVKDPYNTFDFQEDNIYKRWCYKGIYLQLGFHKAGCTGCPEKYQAMTMAMTSYDMMVIERGSLEPRDHSPDDIFFDKNQYEDVLLGFYKDGCGIWCRSLVQLRSKWLVMLKAYLMDRDPISEWDCFVKAGGWYFLQYPKLCP